jgi:peroxiredoxin
MSGHIRSIGAILLVTIVMASAHATEIGGRVKDFQLPDTNGKVHQLYKMSDKKAIVLMTQGNGCPIVRLAMPPLREVQTTFQSRGVEFFLVNHNLQDTAESVSAESQEFGFGLPILLDKTQAVGEQLGVSRTAEIFVIDTQTWKLVYHGPVDDRLNYEAQRPVQHHYLADALNAVLAGKPVAKPVVNSPGCLINFPNRK